MTEQVDYAALRRAMDEATEPPWRYAFGHVYRPEAVGPLTVCSTVDGERTTPRTDPDGYFIALARTAMPEMLALLVEAREFIEAWHGMMHKDFICADGCGARDLISRLPEDV